MVIACHSPQNVRTHNLTSSIQLHAKAPVRLDREKLDDAARRSATELIATDEHGAATNLYSQNVRDAFALADLVIRTDTSPEEFTEPQRALERFFQLYLRVPKHVHTPTRDEQGMFLAYAASLRSSALTRKVGAAICTAAGQLLAIGTNEAPARGGGAYWSDTPSEKDHDGRTFRLLAKGAFDEDPAKKLRREVLTSVFQRLKEMGSPYSELFFNPRDSADAFEAWQQQHEASGVPGRTLLDDTIEYNREVHAEALALTDAARRGVAVQGGVLYVTALPCHDCAKHIVAAGIKRVVYLAPYPKSLVREFYGDSIHIEGDPDDAADRSATAPAAGGDDPATPPTGGAPPKPPVHFANFVGVAPRRYAALFDSPWGVGARLAGSEESGLRQGDYGDEQRQWPIDLLTLIAMVGEITVYRWMKVKLEAGLGTELASRSALPHDAIDDGPTDFMRLPLCGYDGLLIGGSAPAATAPDQAFAEVGRALAVRATEVAVGMFDACQRSRAPLAVTTEDFRWLLEQQEGAAARSNDPRGWRPSGAWVDAMVEKRHPKPNTGGQGEFL